MPGSDNGEFGSPANFGSYKARYEIVGRTSTAFCSQWNYSLG